MKEFIYDWVKIIVSSVIVLTVFESLLPNDKIKKTGMFIGKLIFMLSVIIPVVSLLNSTSGRDFWDDFYKYSFKMDSITQEKIDSGLDNQKKMIENLYYKNTVNIIENYVSSIEGIQNCNADVIIDKKGNSENYGDIKKIYAYVTYERGSVNKPSVKDIENKIAEYFKINSEYIYVEIM